MPVRYIYYCKFGHFNVIFKLIVEPELVLGDLEGHIRSF